MNQYKEDELIRAMLGFTVDEWKSKASKIKESLRKSAVGDYARNLISEGLVE